MKGPTSPLVPAVICIGLTLTGTGTVMESRNYPGGRPAPPSAALPISMIARGLCSSQNAAHSMHTRGRLQMHMPEPPQRCP